MSAYPESYRNHPNKDRRLNPSRDVLLQDELPEGSLFEHIDDAWTQAALFALEPSLASDRHIELEAQPFENANEPLVGPLIGDAPPDGGTYELAQLDSELVQEPFNAPSKRKHTDFTEEVFDGGFADDLDLDDGLTAYLQAQFPAFFPSLPSEPGGNHVSLVVPNPFVEASAARYSAQRTTFTLPEDGAVNGYIKFRLRSTDNDDENANQPPAGSLLRPSLAVHQRSVPGMNGDTVAYLPPGFGSGCKLDATDSKLLKFYTFAFCAGRTLVTKSNFWLVDITAIADNNPCVRHALLASTAAYVLDYLPNNTGLRKKANAHYQKATEQLTEALSDANSRTIGKEESLVAAILLLLCDDIVNWELRPGAGCNPKWFQATRIAKDILDSTDPGYRYWKVENVQSSRARQTLANRIAFVDILAQPVSPLKTSPTDRLYGWLLEGREVEARRIYPGTGLCPKLLHIFAQVTDLAARMEEDPESIAVPKYAEQVERRLAALHQWSEVSPGYQTAQALFDSCVLDNDGKVDDRTKVVELIGEAWRAAVQLYLQCRYYKKPRLHSDVLGALHTLLRTIQLMPSTGPLFTSQSPFFPVFLSAVVASREEDRQVARDWFDIVVSGAGCRSSVPPIWKVVQDLWEWMDKELQEDLYDEELPIARRYTWWEKMVDRLIETEGLLSLC